MLPVNFVQSLSDGGEIDIMEAVGYEPKYVRFGMHSEAYAGETVVSAGKTSPCSAERFS
ncbi:MAG: hypothetical protein LBD73_05485 [Deferribacteraceae bacterium]|jgi:hypothetical protein|nr:hypothetical protein [Deferribacteraceae bacterium]